MNMKKINLTQTTDARIWAKEWLKTIKKHPEIPKDEGTMIGWFANSLMAGYDSAMRKNNNNEMDK
jgi:hypothetical protein